MGLGANFEADHRLYLLDLAVQTHPDTPANYLFRAEHWITLGHYHMARGDLETVERLATERLTNSDWGYLDQSYRDRAAALAMWITERLDG